MNLKQPLLLKNTTQHYTWGEKGSNAFIPRFLGVKSAKDTPHAELWIGAHFKAPSLVEVDNRKIPLNKLIKKYPKEILGKNKKELSFLLKILSAHSALSIQSHPNKKQAQLLRKKDPKNYPDSNQKNEIAIALTPFTLLYGFKKEMYILMYISFLNFFGKENFDKIKLQKNPNKFILETIFKKAKDKNALVEVINGIEKEIKKKKIKSKTEKMFLLLKKEYGTDVGVLISMFMNIVELKPGEALYLPNNTLHSYVKGNVIECMSNSDNTIRAGLTSKFKDVDILLKNTDYSCGAPKILSKKYAVPTKDFEIEKIVLEKNKKINFKNTSLKIFLIIKGEVFFEWGSEKKKYKKGQAILVPAVLDNFRLTTTKTSEIFVVK